MGDPKDPIKPLPKSTGFIDVDQLSGTGVKSPVLPGGQKSSKYDGETHYSDPFFTGGTELSWDERMKSIEGGFDSAQSGWDKVGNGLAKFGGTFAESVVSAGGTIWGLAGSPFMGADYIWNNPINNAGSSINEYVQENFRNYRSVSEQNAGAWSPDHWLSLNFFADNILGNAGYAAGAYVTGMGVSKLLNGLAPLAGTKALQQGMNIARTEGVEALKAFSKAHSAVKNFDRGQMIASTMFSATSEASIEALGAYKEFKQKKTDELIGKYGSEEAIPEIEIARLEDEAKNLGNVTFGLNIPILTASNIFQFGKSLMSKKLLTNASAQANTRIAMTSNFGNYATQEAKSGFKAGLGRALKSIGKGAKNNLSEMGEEGVQFLASEGSKNYYSRKFDKDGTATWDDMAEGYWHAFKDLFTTQEGAANLISGFATPSMMPYNYKTLRNAIFNSDNKAATNYQLQQLNSLDVKNTIKKQMEFAIRGASVNADLDKAIQEGNNYEIHNNAHDLMKNYVQSRIEAGRYDLLEDEIDRMTKMSKDAFKEYFNIETEADFDHKKMLDNYKSQAKDMQKTWIMLERLFQPAMYRFNNQDDDSQKKAIEQMNTYREVAWSYMMDAKDSDRRIASLRKEVDHVFGGLVSTQSLFGNKSTDTRLNELVKEYNTAAVEFAISKQLDPGFEDKVEAKYLKGLTKRMKAKINKHVKENQQSLGLPEYLSKGEPEYLEQYLFEVDNQLTNIDRNAIFQKALFGGDGSMVDVREAISKLDDLRKLDKRRMLAVQSYNNYSSLVREGKFTDIKVKNPSYDAAKHANQKEFIEKDGQQVANPEYQPEFILNEKLLKGDNYKQFQDEREAYREEQRKKEVGNQKEVTAFTKELDRIEKLKSDHPKAAAFQTAFNKYFHGDAPTKGYINMDDDEFADVVEDLNKESLRNEYNGTFNANSQEARDNFDYDQYIDFKARRKAVDTNLTKRKSEIEEAAKKEGGRVVIQYEKIFNEVGKDQAEQFYSEVVKHFTDSNNTDALAVIQPMLDEKRKELGVIGQPAGKQPEQQPEEEETEEQPSLQADLSGKKVVITPGKEFPKGSEPNNAKGGTTSEDEKAIEEILKAQRDETGTYLIVQRSDLKTEQVESIYPIKTLDKVKAGDTLIIDGKEGVVKMISTDSVIVVHDPQTPNGNTGYSKADLHKLAQDGKLEKAYPHTENEYDDKGNVVAKQFNADLYDPKSPISLTPGRKIKLERANITKAGEVWVKMWVKNEKEDSWVDTNMSWTLDGDRIAQRFPKHSKVKPETIEAIKDEVMKVANELKNRKTVLGEISDDKTGFGMLIFNQGEAGKREAKGIGDAIGLEYLNNDKVTGGAYIGVLDSDQIEGADVKTLSSASGRLVSLNQRSEVYVPQYLIDAVTKKGNKAGQAVIALPTGKFEGKKQIHFPVLLNTRDMVKDLSGTMVREDGKQMTIAESVVDVLLNPGKPEYAKQLRALFEVVGADWNNGAPDWDSFYTNDNMFSLMNRVFFAGAAEKGAGVMEETARYKYPFSLFVNKDANGRLNISIDISKTAGTLNRTKKKAVVYLQNEDKSWNTRSAEERINNYITSAPQAGNDGKPTNIDRSLTYKEIQDTLRAKPYRIDMELATQPVAGANPFTAIVFDENGSLVSQKYDSYLHYVNDKQLLETTVQGIKSGNGQFYFVNPVIPYKINFNEKDNTATETIKVRQRANKAAVKDVVKKDFEETPPTADDFKGLIKVGLDDKGNIIEADVFNDPLSTKLAAWGKKKPGKAMIDFNAVRTVKQWTIEGLENIVAPYAEQVNQEMLDMILEEFANSKKSKTFKKHQLKRMLRERLESRLTEYEDSFKRLVAKKDNDAANMAWRRISGLRFALTHFDNADFDKSLNGWQDMNAEEHKDALSYGRDGDGKRIYFLGFFNLALTELFKSKVIDAGSNGKDMLDFDGRDELNYTARFDDNWSVKIDPRNTISKWARILMQQVPQQVFNESGELVTEIGALGSPKYMTYESVHKALISVAGVNLLPDQFHDFINSIPTAPEYSSNPALVGIHKLLQSIKSGTNGVDRYEQAISQLFNPVILQQADYLIIESTTESDRNADLKMYKAGRQMINDEIVSRWSQGFRNLIQQGKYISSRPEEIEGVPVTQYYSSPVEIDGVKASLSDYLAVKIRNAFALKKGKERYEAVAGIYVNDLGFHLSSVKTVEATAAVLAAWDKPGKKDDIIVGARFFKHIYETNNLQRLVQYTLVDVIAKTVEAQLVSDSNSRSTFNPEEPLGKVTHILNAYAKGLKGYFDDVVNATLTDINNNNRYLYVARNNISEQMLKVQQVEHLWELANTSYGKYMPWLSDIFRKDDNGNFIGVDSIDQEAFGQWQRMSLDYSGGIKKNKYRKSESKNANEATWSLLSMQLFHNNEKIDDKQKTRTQYGKYLMAFGDASTAPYYEAPKQEFAINFELKDDNYQLKISDIVGDTRVGTVKQQLYNIFKNEVNRSVEAIAKFQKYNKLKKAKVSRMQNELRPGFHFNMIGDNPVMGSAAGIYGFDQDVFDMMHSENSPLFVMENGRVTGIRQEVMNGAALNDAYIQQVFDGIADDFVNRLVDAKMKQLEPMMGDLLELKTSYEPNQEGWVLNSYKFKEFSNTYIKSFQKLIGMNNGQRVTVDGAKLREQSKKETKDEKDRTVFATEDEVYKRSYPALLLRAMVADQQINHFVFNNVWSAFNMVDPADYQKLGSVSYKEIMDNYTKRMKGMVTPKQQTVLSKGDKVNIITFNDPVVKDFKTTVLATTSTLQSSIVDYLLTTPVTSKGEKLATIDSNKRITLPTRILGQQGEVFFAINEEQWNDKKGATPKSKALFNKNLMNYMNSKVTDGNSYITLREYLYRQLLDGTIARSEFMQLHDFFNNKNLSLTSAEFKSKLPLLGLKYVQSGGKVEDGEMHRIYGKDGKFVLFPAVTKGTHMDQIREDLEALEDKGINPGIQLSPLSVMKLGARNIVSIFNSDGKYNSGIQKARVEAWPRDVEGKQVQNPDKLLNETTASSQAATSIHDNIPYGTKFGIDKFFKETVSRSNSQYDIIDIDDWMDEDDSHNQLLERLIASSGKPTPAKKTNTWTKNYLTNRDLMQVKYRLTSELMRRDLVNLMGQWGIKVEAGGEEYNTALIEAGLTAGATPKELSAVIKGDDKKKADAARLAYRLRNQLVMRNIDMFLSGIKDQLIRQKGLSPNNTYLIRKVEGLTNMIEVPITFNPNSSYIQSVILSRVNAIVQGRKLPGFSFVQMSNLGFGKKEITGNADLKGYSPIYDAKGNIIGANSAEIAIPWRFTDKQGNLLEYSDYVNEDGTPKKDRWDADALKVIGLRIPNTGPNTMGYYKVVRFLPGYKDVAQVPMEVLAQMNSDFDFDKFVTYIYKHTVEGGKITKVQGYMDESQAGVEKLLTNSESIKKAIQHQLTETNPEYKNLTERFETVINGWIKQNAVDLLEEKNETLEDDETPFTVDDMLSLSRAEKIDLIYISGIISDDGMGGIMHILDAIEAEETETAETFDMAEFLKETPNALEVLQSPAQLENALIDTYHLILREPSVLKRMLTPLTTDAIKEQITRKQYRGKSLSEIKSLNDYASPHAEISKTQTRSSSTGADTMIGVMANFAQFIHLAQHADLALSNQGLPVYFGDKNGNVITEQDYNADVFPVSKTQFDKTAIDPESKEYRGMLLSKENKVYKLPYRLGRISGRDRDNNNVSVSEMGQSILQAALDNFNDPILGTAGISVEVANELALMLSLGYIDHAIPFLNQPIIREYVSMVQATKGVMTDMTYAEGLEELMMKYANLIGADIEALEKQVIENRMDTDDDRADVTTQELLSAMNESVERALTVDELADMIATPEEEKDIDFHKSQLWVLEMMLRMKKYGQTNFEVQQWTNVHSKGIKDTSVLGADEQLTNYNKVKDLPLINADRVVANNSQLFLSNAAKRYGLDPVRDLFKFGKDTGMIQDLKEAFTTFRKMTGLLTKNNQQLETKKQINIGIIQFVLSDPELYGDLISEFMERVPTSAHDVRQFLMKEDYGTNRLADGTLELDLENNSATTLATLLEDISKRSNTDEFGNNSENTELYDILDNLRPIKQKSNDNPSVAIYQNANNYKSRLDVLLPLSIVRMMESEDPKVRKIARMLMVYPYLNGGINNPVSFLSHVPQEILFEYGFTERLRKKMDDLNSRFKTMMNEFNGRQEDENDDRPYIQKLLSGDYIRNNGTTLNTLKSFIIQFYQHQPFQLSGKYVVGTDKIDDITDPNNVTFKDMDSYPFLLMVRGKDRSETRLYVNNGDDTYTATDDLSARFNNAQYDYNEKGRPGYTLTNKFAANPIEVTVQPVATRKKKGETNLLPYRLRSNDGPIKADYSRSFHDVLSWVKDDAQEMMERMPDQPMVQRIQSSMVQLIDYLMPKIPDTVAFELDATMKEKGFAEFNKGTGMPEKISYNYDRVVPGETESSDFKHVMMHEALHAAGGRAIGLIENVLNNNITDTQAAKVLKVNVKTFRDMMEGYKSIKTLIGKKDFTNGKSFRQTLLEEWTYVEAQAAGLDFSRSKANIVGMENVLKLKVDNAVGDVEEFMAMMLSDAGMRKALNNLQYETDPKKNKSVWQKLKELFMKILGIEPGSVLEDAFYNSMRILDPLSGVTPLKTELGNVTVTAGKAMPDFNYLEETDIIFSPELNNTIPFAVDLQDVAERFNYKQKHC